MRGKVKTTAIVMVKYLSPKRNAREYQAFLEHIVMKVLFDTVLFLGHKLGFFPVGAFFIATFSIR